MSSLATFGILVFISFTIWGVPIWAQIGLFAVAVLTILLHYEKSGPMHPAAWFSAFLFLYSVNYPLFMLGLGDNHPKLQAILPLNYLALMGFLSGVILISRRPLAPPTIQLNAQALRFLIILLLIGSCGLIAFTLLLGLGSKREFIDKTRDLGIAPLYLIFQMVTISYLVYALQLSEKFGGAKGLRKVFFTPLGQCVFVVLLLSFGATGERDVIFRLGLLIYFCLVVTGRGPNYRFWHYAAIGFLGVYLTGLLQTLKGFLLSADSIDPGGVKSLFWNEFASAGRNLDFILSRNVERLNGETYIWAVQRYFDFLYPDAISATQWFNSGLRYEFGEGGTSGWGFSLVAEAYLNFGPIGVFCVFLLVGVLSSTMYHWARKSAFGFAYYLLFVPTLIYVSRADLGNLLSLHFKANLFLVSVPWIFTQMLEKLSPSTANHRRFERT